MRSVLLSAPNDLANLQSSREPSSYAPDRGGGEKEQDSDLCVRHEEIVRIHTTKALKQRIR